MEKHCFATLGSVVFFASVASTFSDRDGCSQAWPSLTRLVPSFTEFFFDSLPFRWLSRESLMAKVRRWQQRKDGDDKAGDSAVAGGVRRPYANDGANGMQIRWKFLSLPPSSGRNQKFSATRKIPQRPDGGETRITWPRLVHQTPPTPPPPPPPPPLD